MSVSVVIGTFGDKEKWFPLAERATKSAWSQTEPPAQVLHVHGETLAIARNRGIEEATSEWLIFLDADDELDPGYIKAMQAAEGDVRRPRTLGIYPDGTEDDFPVMIPEKRLLDANFIVIGAMVRREMASRVGGFDEYPMSEDWAFWIKVWLEGATITEVPEAIYRVNVVPGSRNSDPKLGGKVYGEIKSRFTREARARGII